MVWRPPTPRGSGPFRRGIGLVWYRMRGKMTQPKRRGSRLGHGVAVFGVALWAGLVTGLIEALIFWFKQAIVGQVIFASREMLWMTPLAYMLIFGAVGIVVSIVAVVFPRYVTIPTGLFLFTAFGVGCLLLPVGQLHRFAMALLAIGVGVQSARQFHQPGERTPCAGCRC